MNSEQQKDIEEHINTFHNLMIDVLRRRALFRAFEKKLKNKATYEEIYKNSFISFYMMDYSRVQLIDLRKFFETDPSSYKVSFLIHWINDPKLTQSHKNLFIRWKEKFEEKVNMSIAHIDKKSKALDKQVSKEDVDDFIDETNHFLDDICSSIRKTGTLTLDENLRDLNSDFLNKAHNAEFEKYLKWSCGPR